jgi:hypothetical protein
LLAVSGEATFVQEESASESHADEKVISRQREKRCRRAGDRMTAIRKREQLEALAVESDEAFGAGEPEEAVGRLRDRYDFPGSALPGGPSGVVKLGQRLRRIDCEGHLAQHEPERERQDRRYTQRALAQGM